MEHILEDMIGKDVNIVICGIANTVGVIVDVDCNWIKIKYGKKEKIKIYNKKFVSSINLL